MTAHYQFSARTATSLCAEFEEALGSGGLQPGERLPSIRAVAVQVGISPSTVSAAFAELRRRGLLVTRDRGASWVAERRAVPSAPAPVAVPAGVVDLATGNPDPLLLPPLAALAAGGAAARPIRLYGEPAVVPGLVTPVHDRLVAAGVGPHDDRVSAARSVVVSGALDGIERALAATLVRPSRVAVEDPAYDTLLALVRALGHEPVPMPVDAGGPTVRGLDDALAAGARAVILTSRAQNPTGAALDRDRATALAETLSGHPRVLTVENDHLGDVAGAPLHSVAGASAHWVYVHSFAKSLGPDLRVAVALGDTETIDRMAARHALGPGWVSGILQETVVATLADSRTAGILDRARAVYRSRREALAAAVAELGIVVVPGTGFNVWVPVADEAAVVAGLLARGWAVAPGSRYRLASAPGIRVTVSSMTPAQVRAFARDLSAVLHDDVPRRGA